MRIPWEIRKTVRKIEQAGFRAYLVGGCVRDLLRHKKPQDWDIATNAKPQDLEALFEHTFANNEFGTVTVITEARDPTLKNIEITPFRIEEKYSDQRHPDKIKWAETIEEDLKRRDFTVNAMALSQQTANTKEQRAAMIVDPFNGQEDLKSKVIKAVGKPEERFSEDALRLMRAVRFAVSLSPEAVWKIEPETKTAIKNKAPLLKCISKERIRDELLKIICSENGARGIELLRRLNLLAYIIPELEQGLGVTQNKHHIYQVYEHNLLALNYACQHKFSTEVRLAALLHDIGKPKTKQGQGPEATFYNHEIVSAQLAYNIMRRLRFPQKTVEKVSKLVRYHLFYYTPEEVTASSVRKLLKNVGKENIEQLLQLRYCDRIGSGVPKAIPYKLRHLKYMIEKVSKDPISVRMLKLSGKEVMEILNINPGPKVGKVLNCLLARVLKNPENNNRTFLEKEIVHLGKEMSENAFNRVSRKAEGYIQEVKTKRDEMTKAKYWVS